MSRPAQQRLEQLRRPHLPALEHQLEPVQARLAGARPDTRALLIDGTLDAVITQSPQSVVGNAVRIFANLRDGRDAMTGVEALRLNLALRENLP